MNEITEALLAEISDFKSDFKGAYNIRENGQCVGRRSSEHIRIELKSDKSGIDIFIDPFTKGERVYIPACVTKSRVSDLVYNDFFVGEGADVVIVAGCGVHADNEGEAKHNGVHRFFLGKGARVLYQEKHLGTGKKEGFRRIDPITDAILDEDSCLEMDTVQLGGVDSTVRKTTAKLAARAKLVVRERIMTDGEDRAETDFAVEMNGEDSAVDLVSRSVARGSSYQEFRSAIYGNDRCTGHSECDAILVDHGRVNASPALEAAHLDAALIHEAAIGKIAGDQILKLQTLGLTEEEAEEKIISGFLK
ncbi:MAG: SufD family Fe-S cluster assembly protein [Bacteroides sp.]|nr:SufD family Fe-S cluster assembly protein [Eubacterium sp.]MCM1417704.1 SufD family Fe-S cluster assembly protein [Roseburia sp.]MCM1461830.1 SufD family Fe-S cluster assembly protein [Bacteroides sp.]